VGVPDQLGTSYVFHIFTSGAHQSPNNSLQPTSSLTRRLG